MDPAFGTIFSMSSNLPQHTNATDAEATVASGRASDEESNNLQTNQQRRLSATESSSSPLMHKTSSNERVFNPLVQIDAQKLQTKIDEYRHELATLRNALGPARWPTEEEIQAAPSPKHSFYPGRVLVGHMHKSGEEIWGYLTKLTDGGSTGFHFVCGTHSFQRLATRPYKDMDFEAWYHAIGDSEEDPTDPGEIWLQRARSVVKLAMFNAGHFEGALGSIKLRNWASVSNILVAIGKNDKASGNLQRSDLGRDHEQDDGSSLVEKRPRSETGDIDPPRSSKWRKTASSPKPSSPLSSPTKLLLPPPLDVDEDYEDPSTHASPLREICSTEQALEDIDQQYKELRKENKELRDANTDLLASRAFLQEEVWARSKTVAQSKHENDVLNKSTGRKDDRIQALQVYVTELKDSNELQAAELAECRTAQDTQAQEIAMLEVAIEELKKKAFPPKGRTLVDTEELAKLRQLNESFRQFMGSLAKNDAVTQTESASASDSAV